MRSEKNFLSLTAGQRFKLEGGKVFARVKSGKVEAYAVMSGEGSFRQEFLAEVDGGAIFPALDEFEQVETLIYALEDAELEILEFEAVTAENLRGLM